MPPSPRPRTRVGGQAGAPGPCPWPGPDLTFEGIWEISQNMGNLSVPTPTPITLPLKPTDILQYFHVKNKDQKKTTLHHIPVTWNCGKVTPVGIAATGKLPSCSKANPLQLSFGRSPLAGRGRGLAKPAPGHLALPRQLLVASDHFAGWPTSHWAPGGATHKPRRMRRWEGQQRPRGGGEGSGGCGAARCPGACGRGFPRGYCGLV